VLVAQTVTQPADTIKTRIMNDAAGVYRGSLHCLRKTVSQEGMRALYR
jgi:hypothetical protein